MKKFLKKSMMALMFTFAFLFVGVSVKAAVVTVSDNTNMSGNVISYKVGENQQYVINDTAEEGKITLTSVKNSTKAGWWIFKNEKALLAKVVVVRCGELDEGNKCNTWYSYSYSEDKTTTMDSLKQEGLVLNFKKDSFKPAVGVTEISGVTLEGLNSIHGLADTYFVLVQYEAYRALKANDVFPAEIYKIVFAKDMSPLTIETTTSGESIVATAKSALPIVGIRYFHTTTKFQGSYDYATEFDKAGNGESLVVENGQYAAGKDNVYSLEMTVPKIEKGQYYYVEATDVAGNKVLLDLDSKSFDKIDDGANWDESTFTSTPVGKIILGVLIAVLVIALVLVIVQKIIDKRKKLY